MKASQKLIAANASLALHLYGMHDPLPLPEVIESDSDAAWALWKEIAASRSSEPELDFQDTEIDDRTEFPAWFANASCNSYT